MSGIEHDIVRNGSLEKMSEILLEYAEPFLEIIDLDNKAEYEKAIMLAIMLWNCAIMEKPGKNIRKKLEKILKPLMPGVNINDNINNMIERKRQMFPDNKRIIISFDVTETSDDYHISVASTAQ